MSIGSLGGLGTTPRSGAPRRAGVPTMVALLLLGLALTVDLVVAVIPAYAFGNQDPLPEVVTLLISLVAFAVYGAVVALVGRTTPQRLVAAGLVLLAAALHVAFFFVLTRGPLRPDSIDGFQTLLTVRRVLLGLLLVGAWCAARRVGHWWWLGLVAVVVLVLAQALVRDEVGARIARIALGDDGRFDAPSLALNTGLVWAWSTLALLVAGAVCWVVDLLSTPGTTTARHPRG